MAFKMYKVFINNALNNLMHPHITSFSDYIKVTLSTLVLLLFLLIIGTIIFFLIRIPFIIYKKKIKPVETQLRSVSFHSEERIKFRKELAKRRILFIVILILVYVPILLPLICILIDLISFPAELFFIFLSALLYLLLLLLTSKM